MKITMAATSAYDQTEIHIHLMAEEGETIRIGDIIDIPMIDHSFERRKITAFVSTKREKSTLIKIESGEMGVAVIHNIYSRWIKTECNVYVDDDITGAVCTGTNLIRTI